MIYKITCSVSGDNLLAENIVPNLSGDFDLKSYHSPTDKKFENVQDRYGYGGMLFWHPKEFSSEEFIAEYEGAFVDFLEFNHSLFINNGAEDIELYIEIYYDGGQCNFEIFSRDLLNKLAKYHVSIPVSIYALSEKEMEKWKNEIEIAWRA